MFNARPKIGVLLLRHGIINDSQLERALAHSRQGKTRLGESLVKLGLCTDLDVSRALAQQNEVPFVDLQTTPPTIHAISLVPGQVARQYRFIPVRVEGDRLIVAATDPFDLRVDEAARRSTGMRVIVAQTSETQLNDFLARYEQLKRVEENRFSNRGGAPRLRLAAEDDSGGTEPRPANLSLIEQTRLVEQVNQMLCDAVRQGAEELHFEPGAEGLLIRWRIDGEMWSRGVIQKELAHAYLTRIRLLCGMDARRERGNQEGSFEQKVEGRTIEFRGAALPGIGGDILSLKVLDKEVAPLPLDSLGLADDLLLQVREILNRRAGVLLVSGSTQSGRRSTLKSLLQAASGDRVLSISVEDRVEQTVAGVQHFQANASAGQTVNGLLRMALRQSPQVVMLSEIQDADTAELVCRSGHLGQLVLAGLYSPGALQAISRLIELPLAAHTVTGSVVGVLSQRLALRNCPQCAVDCRPIGELARALEDRFGDVERGQFRRGTGCNQCLDRGVRGRIGIFEFLNIDPDLAHLIALRSAPSLIRAHAEKQGFRSMELDAWDKACRGIIPVQSVLPHIRGEVRDVAGARAGQAVYSL